MTDPYDIRDDLEPGVDENLVLLADRLRKARPLPRPAFRGDLGRHLAIRSKPRFAGLSLRAVIGANTLAGVVLLGIGAISATGVGPLG